MTKTLRYTIQTGINVTAQHVGTEGPVWTCRAPTYVNAPRAFMQRNAIYKEVRVRVEIYRHYVDS